MLHKIPGGHVLLHIAVGVVRVDGRFPGPGPGNVRPGAPGSRAAAAPEEQRDAQGQAFLQNKDAAYIQRQLALKNRVCRIVIVMAAVLVIIVAILGTLRLIDWYQFTHGYVVETIYTDSAPSYERALEVY